MSEREWYEEFYKLCGEHGFEVCDYWGYLKIKTKQIHGTSHKCQGNRITPWVRY